METPGLSELDRDIRAGYAQRSGRFERFLEDWIKYRDNGDKLYRARGQRHETLLQYKLSRRDVVGAHALFRVAKEVWSKDSPAWLFDYLNHEDSGGNGIWHYLADAIQGNEGFETLTLARELVALDVDFSRTNRDGISPLGKMVLPRPRWKSLNALIQAGCLTMADIERAVAEHAHHGAECNAILSHILSEDAANNRSILCGTIVRQALDPKAERDLRVATAAKIFDHVDPRDGSVPFFSLIAYADSSTFDDVLRLLTQQVEEAVMALAPPDVTSKKAYRQALLCRRVLRRDNAGEGVLFKALKVGNTMHLRKVTSLLINDDLHIGKLVRGEYTRQPVTIERSSPAPSNPLLSLLLQRGVSGNTMFHEAAFAGEKGVLEGCLLGLGSNDIYAILTAVPNAAGITLRELGNFDLCRTRIHRATTQKAVTEAEGQTMLAQIGRVPADVVQAIQERIAEIRNLAADTKGGAPIAPSFELSRVQAGAAPA